MRPDLTNWIENTEKPCQLCRIRISWLPMRHSAICDAYGLNQVGIEGLSPDSEPDPARMAEVIDFVRANGVKVIFFEELVSPKVAETIAKETGAATQVLNPLEGLSDEEQKSGADYFSVMEENLKQLEAALTR